MASELLFKREIEGVEDYLTSLEMMAESMEIGSEAEIRPTLRRLEKIASRVNSLVGDLSPEDWVGPTVSP